MAQLLEPGKRVGRYVVVGHLGTGGMAEVYAARDGSALNARLVALKRLRPHLAAQPGFTRMFVREARLAASLDHPNILGLLGVEEVDGETILVMPHVDGRDLGAILGRAGRLPLALGLRVAIDVGRALDHAHHLRDEAGNRRDIVHRDVSPANVLVSFHGAVKLADFGLARVAEQTVRTAPGMLKGKFGYMAPEQYLEEPVDARSDVFGLGVVLYEMTTGKRAFHGDRGPEIVNRVLEGRYRRPRELDPSYPIALAAIVERALEIEPAARFASAAEVVAALEAFAEGHALDPTEVALGRFVRELFPEADPPAADAFMLSSDRPPSAGATLGETRGGGSARGARLWIVLGVLVLVVAALIAIGLAAR